VNKSAAFSFACLNLKFENNILSRMISKLVFVSGVIILPKRYDMRQLKYEKQIIKNFRLFYYLFENAVAHRMLCCLAVLNVC
jgi:hypothetical protein